MRVTRAETYIPCGTVSGEQVTAASVRQESFFFMARYIDPVLIFGTRNHKMSVTASTKWLPNTASLRQRFTIRKKTILLSLMVSLVFLSVMETTADAAYRRYMRATGNETTPWNGWRLMMAPCFSHGMACSIGHSTFSVSTELWGEQKGPPKLLHYETYSFLWLNLRKCAYSHY